MKTFTCKMCNVTFDSITKGNAFYCPTCRKKMKNIRTDECRQRKNPKVKLGVGSGGNQEGENNHQWKGGKRTYSKICSGKYCEICSSTEDLCTHHKNFDHNDNRPGNLQKLCRSCHAKVHDFASHFLQAEVKPTQNEELSEKISCSQ